MNPSGASPRPAGAERQTHPELGVVIVSYNTRQMLDDCLLALGKALQVHSRRSSEPRVHDSVPSEDDAESQDDGSIVWVVDNASHDGSADMVAERHPWVRVHRLERNIGFTAANNLVLQRWLGTDMGTPHNVLLLNPDTEVDEHAVTVLCDALHSSDDIGMVGPSLEYADGRFQHSAFKFPGLAQTLLDFWPINRLVDHGINGRYPESRYRSGRPFDVDMILGACMLLRADALRSVGTLDEDFFMYCEEIDWCLRLKDAGWRVVCAPEAQVMHHGGASTSQFRSSSFVHLWRSRRRLMRKHATPGKRIVFEFIVACGLSSKAVSDWVATIRGAMTAEERVRRSKAYRAVWNGDGGE